MISEDATIRPRNNYGELVERISENDSLAFEKLYFLFANRVYCFAKRYLQTEDEIEEVVQEVFTKLWEHRMSLKSNMSINGYLLTITKNTIFNQYRKSLNHKAYCKYIVTFHKENKHIGDNDIVYNELKQIVENAIENLPPQRRKVFKLSRFKGYAYKEISDELGLAEKTVEAHIRLAIRDIKKVLEPEYN